MSQASTPKNVQKIIRKNAQNKTNKKKKKIYAKQQVQGTQRRLAQRNMVSAKNLALLEGQRGVDPRSSSVDAPMQLDKALTVPNSQSVLVVTCTLDPETIESLALSIILRSLKKGWAGTLKSAENNFPYAAYVYLVRAFLTVCSGSVPQISTAPEWYWIVADCLRPKLANFKTGSVRYQWDLGIINPTEYTPANVRNASSTVVLGFSDSTSLLWAGMREVQVGVYDPTIGENAIQSLFDYTQNTYMTSQSEAHGTMFIRDTSAFAAISAEFGSAKLTPCGMVSSVFSERKISSPILSKFSPYQSEEGSLTNFRGWKNAIISGGSPAYIIPRIMEMGEPKQLFNKVAPIFKQYDFGEFYEVLSLTLAAARNLAANDGLGGAIIPPCPLNPLEVAIILRQTILPVFANEMAHDVHFEADSSPPTVPFSVGSNGCSLVMSTAQMQLPQFFAENVRACSRRVVKLSAKNMDSQADYVPILMSQLVLINPINYTWDEAGTEVIWKPYPTPPDPPSPIILMFDLRIQGEIPETFVDGNSPIVTEWILMWNEWIQSLSTFLSPLTTIGAEDGIRALSTVFTTYHNKQLLTELVAGLNVVGPKESQDALGKMKKEKPEKEKLTPKSIERKSSKERKGRGAPNRRKKVGAGVGPETPSLYQSQSTVRISSTNQFLTPIWKYQQVMICPVFVSTIPYTSIAASQAQQAFQVEPYSLVTTVNAETDVLIADGELLVYDRHLLMAQFDVRSKLAPKKELEADLETLGRMGRGGLFTSLASLIGGDLLGIPYVKEIAGAVSSISGGIL